MAAERLAQHGLAPVVIEGSRTPGRKFLVAGRGGLNLTHVGDPDQLLRHYGPERQWLAPHLHAFDGAALREWADQLGAETFVGSSGRVFPKALKATGLLRAWLARLDQSGVTLMLRTRFIGWTSTGGIKLQGPDGPAEMQADACVLALGGASWPRLGSDGAWAAAVRAQGVAVRAFQPANGGMLVPWSEVARARFQGLPLKNLQAFVGDEQARGELMLTEYGLEGQLVYALGRALRAQLDAQGHGLLHLDLKPDLTREQIEARLAVPRGSLSWSNWLTKRLRVPPPVPTLLREGGIVPSSSTAELAGAIKRLPLRIVGTRPIAEAISTAGGVELAEVDKQLMLRKHPGVFVAGEMLDWEAPTGGYLLQASFATGAAAAEGVVAWLKERSGSSPHEPSFP